MGGVGEKEKQRVGKKVRGESVGEKGRGRESRAGRKRRKGEEELDEIKHGWKGRTR